MCRYTAALGKTLQAIARQSNAIFVGTRLSVGVQVDLAPVAEPSDLATTICVLF